MSEITPADNPTSRLPDAIAAGVAMSLGAAALYWAIETGRDDALAIFALRGALWFPAIVAALLFAAGAALAFRTVRGGGQDNLDIGYFGVGVAGAAGLALHAGAVFVVGFWPASTLAILGFGWLLGHPLRSPWLLGTAVVFPGAIQYTFALALAVQMPVPQVN